MQSFFGMNVHRGPPGSSWSNSSTISGTLNTTGHNYTLQTAEDMTIANILTTANITTLTDQPSNVVWDIKVFWATAFALAIGTIIVPLIAPAIFRWVFHLEQRHKFWTRPVLWGVILPLIAAL